MTVLKFENIGKKGKNPPKYVPTLKIQSCQIKLKVGIDIKTDAGNSKIMVLKSENNGNHTPPLKNEN